MEGAQYRDNNEVNRESDQPGYDDPGNRMDVRRKSVTGHVVLKYLFSPPILVLLRSKLPAKMISGYHTYASATSFVPHSRIWNEEYHFVKKKTMFEISPA
jgi:hypothetical protein